MHSKLSDAAQLFNLLDLAQLLPYTGIQVQARTSTLPLFPGRAVESRYGGGS